MNSQFALYVVGVLRAFVWLIGLALIWFQAFVGLLRVDVTPVLIAGLVAVLGLIVATTVAVHELGHVLAARIAHVRVDYCRIFCFEFYRDGGRMRFRIDTSRFPLLGMVRYEQSSDLTSLRQSAAVLAGGPAANFLAGLACLGFAALFNPPLTNEWPEHVRSGWRSVAFLHPGNCATAVLNVAAIFQFGCSLLNLLPSWLGPYWSDGASLLALWRTQKAWRRAATRGKHFSSSSPR